MTTIDDLLAVQIAHPDATIVLAPGRNVAGVVGDTTTFQATCPINSPSFALTTKPGGSSASLSSGTITWDVAGAYAITMMHGGLTRLINIIAVPAAIKTVLPGPMQAQWRSFLEPKVQGAIVAANIANMSNSVPWPNAGPGGNETLIPPRGSS